MPAVRARGVALLLLLAGLGCARESDTRLLRLGHGLDVDHPVHRAMELMAERLAQSSGGALRLEIYPNEQLGSERECLELLQIGSLALTKVSAAVLESFAPAFRLYSVPYLFRDEAHRYAVQDGPVGRRLLLATERARLRGLAYYDAGSRSFYTRERPVRRPEDLAGLKIRTQESPSAMALVRALGGSATPLAWGELYSALQQGVVDGAENNAPSYQLSGHYEVARYYSLDEHTGVPDVLLVSATVWERLSPRERAWLEEAALASVPHQRALWKRASEAALRAVEAAGVEILRPDKAPFTARTAALREELGRDPELAELIRLVEAARP